MAKTKRIYWIDKLRAVSIVLVVWHHACLAWATFAAAFLWYSVANRSSEWFDLMLAVMDLWKMAALFLVAGLVGWPSLQRRGAASFSLARAKALGLPFLIGIFFLVPVMPWIRVREMGALSLSFAEYWRRCYIFSSNMEGSHFWFLWVLLAFSLLLVAMSGFPRLILVPAAFISRLHKRKPLATLLLGGVISVGLLVGVNALIVESQWFTFLRVFSVQGSRAVLYFAYFIAGVVIAAGKLPLDKRPKRFPWVSFSLGLVLSFVHLVIIVVFEAAAYYGVIGAIRAAVHALVCLCLIHAVCRIFQRYFAAAPGMIVRSLTRSSYIIYIVHLPLVIICQHLLRHSQLSLLVCFTGTFLGSLAGSWLIAEVFLSLKRRIAR